MYHKNGVKNVFQKYPSGILLRNGCPPKMGVPPFFGGTHFSKVFLRGIFEKHFHTFSGEHFWKTPLLPRYSKHPLGRENVRSHQTDSVYGKRGFVGILIYISTGVAWVYSPYYSSSPPINDVKNVCEKCVWGLCVKNVREEKYASKMHVCPGMHASTIAWNPLFPYTTSIW